MKLVAFSICPVYFVYGQTALSRSVRIEGQHFVHSSTNTAFVLSGPNVVVKGPPWLPSVSGDSICNDTVNDNCIGKGTCTSCFTFSQADIDHIKSLGWNSIRLGVIWAGAQPQDENALDPEFVQGLHAVLSLTDANGIHVVLDNHGDMVGSAGCGSGIPTWFQKKAAPELIGKPLHTGLPYSSIPSLRVSKVKGYNHCGNNATKWAAHAGDPNYNLLNECCQAMNAYPSEFDGSGNLIYNGNPPGLGFTTISQKTMDYLLQEGPGRDDFVRFMKLLTEEVKEHPSAFAIEPMNEPITIRRKWMFDTWHACAEAINHIIPDMLVGICDVGQGSVMPDWFTKLTGGSPGISKDAMRWIKTAGNLFYTWHYGDVPQNVRNMQAISKAWNMPTFATETFCEHWDAAAAAGISRHYWHYSSYCNTGPAFGNRTVPTDTFGACILGWDLGDSSKCSKPAEPMADDDDATSSKLSEPRPSSGLESIRSTRSTLDPSEALAGLLLASHQAMKKSSEYQRRIADSEHSRSVSSEGQGVAQLLSSPDVSRSFFRQVIN